MRWIDYALVVGLAAVGLVHCFVFTPMVYDSLTPGAFWFFGTGLAILFAAALNGLRAICGARAPGVRWAAGLASLAMFALVCVFAASFEAWGRPDVFLQLGLYAASVLMAVLRRG